MAERSTGSATALSTVKPLPRTSRATGAGRRAEEGDFGGGSLMRIKCIAAKSGQGLLPCPAHALALAHERRAEEDDDEEDDQRRSGPTGQR